MAEYTGLWARAFYQPYLRLHAELAETVGKVKRRQGKIFIGDIGRALAGYLGAEIVPGHLLPARREGLSLSHRRVPGHLPLPVGEPLPLVENSLAVGGSLFVVGDTKQAIYGFRQADYTIMRRLESASPFPSAGHVPLELTTNRRSRPRILALAASVFRVAAAASPDYARAARDSGLAEWTQEPLAGDDPGYAEVDILERDDEDPPERRKIHAILEQLRARGYGWGDIAILASRNDDILRATSWLNEKAVPFISFSSLDVRGRKAASEMLALLRLPGFAHGRPRLRDVHPRQHLCPGRVPPGPRGWRHAAFDAGVPLPLPGREAAVQGVPARVPSPVARAARRAVPLGRLPSPLRPGERGLCRARGVRRGRGRGGRPREAAGEGEGVRRLGLEQPAGVPRHGRGCR